VGNVQPGLREHEFFVSDNGTNLSSVDLRNGRIIYSYKQIQGAISDLVPLSSYLASTSRDRFFRLHSTVAPSDVAGKQQDQRGEVLGSLYVKSIPTAVVVDPLDDATEVSDDSRRGEGEEDLWDGMREISDDDDDERPKRARRRPNE